MFTVRSTDSWSAPDDAQRAFLLEGRLDLAATSEPVLLGRERGTGHYMWIKCADGSRESQDRLAAEQRLLHGLQHNHILPLIADHAAEVGGLLLYCWQAEQPLSAALLAQIPCVDRARLASDLLDTVQYLQALSPPVAHGCLVLENLWVTPRVRYLRLAGFNKAQSSADADSLRADRQATVALIRKLLPINDIPSDANPVLDGASEQWLADPFEGYDSLSHALKRALLACVTADL
jgi:hypothetical protein